jgi:hypothetical protein
MTTPRYTWIVITPDGREIYRETGGRDAECRARGVAERVNRHAPRGEAMTQVRMIPY